MENSPFGRLAPELRNAIYHLALTQDDNAWVSIVVVQRGPYVQNQGFRRRIAMAQVCRQMRYDTCVLCFMNVNFKLSLYDAACDSRLPAQYLRSLGRPVLHSIARFTINQARKPTLHLERLQHITQGQPSFGFWFEKTERDIEYRDPKWYDDVFLTLTREGLALRLLEKTGVSSYDDPPCFELMGANELRCQSRLQVCMRISKVGREAFKLCSAEELDELLS